MSMQNPARWSDASSVDEGILEKLQVGIDALPTALARIAKYILENPEKVLHQSVGELGDFSGSGEASILRLCKQIGFSGFRDFKLALAAEIGRSSRRLHPARSSGEAVQVLHDAMRENLGIAHRNTDIDAIDAVAALLASSRRVDLFGSGMSGITAELFAYRLLRAGVTAIAFRDPYMAHEVAGGLGSGCVAIGISISGLTNDTLQFLKGARAAGASTVAITNRSRSPVGDAANVSLRAAGLEDKPIGGTLTPVVGEIFVIECLMAALARRRIDLGEMA